MAASTPRRTGAGRRQGHWIGHAGHGHGRVADGDADGGDAATVDPARRVEEGLPGHLLQDAQEPLLHRMLEADIAPGRLAHMHRGGEHARMLARAVVVAGIGLAPLADEGPGRGLVIGQVGPAFEVGDREPDPGEPGMQGRDMPRLAVMGGAGQGDLGIAEAEGRGGAGLDQAEGQQGLDGRAAVDRLLDIPPMAHDSALGVGDGGGAGMPAFHQVAAGDFDHEGGAGIGHASAQTQ